MAADVLPKYAALAGGGEDGQVELGLHAELAATAERANRAEVQLRSAHANIGQMADQIEQLQQELTEAKCSLAKCQEEAAAAVALAGSLGVRAADLDNQVAVLREVIDGLEQQVAVLGAEESRLHTGLDAAQQTVDEAVATRNLMASQLDEVTQQLVRSSSAAAAAEEQYKASIQQLQVRLAALEAECRALQHAKGAMHDELQRGRAKNFALRVQLQDELRQREELASANRQLHRDLEASLEGLAEAQRAQRSAAAGAMDLEAELERLRSAHSGLEAELRAAEHRMQRLQEENRQLMERNAEMATQLHGFSATVRLLEVETARLSDGHATLRVEAEARAAEVRAARGEAAELAADRARLLAELQASRTDRHPDEVEVMRKALQDSRSEVSRLQREVAANDAVLGEAEAALVALVREREGLAQQLDAARAAERLAAEAENVLRDQVASLRAQLEAMQHAPVPTPASATAPEVDVGGRPVAAAVARIAADERMTTYLQSLVTQGIAAPSSDGGTEPVAAHAGTASEGGTDIDTTQPPGAVLLAAVVMPALARAQGHSSGRYPAGMRTSDSGSAHSTCPAAGTNPEGWEATSTSGWDTSAGGSMGGAGTTAAGVRLFADSGATETTVVAVAAAAAAAAAPGDLVRTGPDFSSLSADGDAQVVALTPRLEAAASARVEAAGEEGLGEHFASAAAATAAVGPNSRGTSPCRLTDERAGKACGEASLGSSSSAPGADRTGHRLPECAGAPGADAREPVQGRPDAVGAPPVTGVTALPPSTPTGVQAPTARAEDELDSRAGNPATSSPCSVSSRDPLRNISSYGQADGQAVASEAALSLASVVWVNAIADSASAPCEPQGTAYCSAVAQGIQPCGHPASSPAVLHADTVPHAGASAAVSVPPPSPVAPGLLQGASDCLKALAVQAANSGSPVEARAPATARAVISAADASTPAPLEPFPDTPKAAPCGFASEPTTVAGQAIMAGPDAPAPNPKDQLGNGVYTMPQTPTRVGAAEDSIAGTVRTGAGSSSMISPRLLLETRMLSRAVRPSAEALSYPLRPSLTSAASAVKDAGPGCVGSAAGPELPGHDLGRADGKGPPTGARTLPIVQALATQQLVRQQHQVHLETPPMTHGARATGPIDLLSADAGAFVTAAASAIATAAAANLTATAALGAGAAQSPAGLDTSMGMSRRTSADHCPPEHAAVLAPSASSSSLSSSRVSAPQPTNSPRPSVGLSGIEERIPGLQHTGMPLHHEKTPLSEAPAGDPAEMCPRPQLAPSLLQPTSLVGGRSARLGAVSEEDAVLSQRLAVMDEALRAIGAA